MVVRTQQFGRMKAAPVSRGRHTGIAREKYYAITNSAVHCSGRKPAKVARRRYNTGRAALFEQLHCTAFEIVAQLNRSDKN
jgi:hypothetical protein